MMEGSEADDATSRIWHEQKPRTIIDINIDKIVAIHPSTSSAPGLSPGTLTSCFLCGSEVRYYHQAKQVSASKDLEVSLEHLLEFPRQILLDYIKKCGPLQNWIPLCNSECRPLIQEGRELTEKIASMEKQLKDRREQIIKKIRNSKVNFSGSVNAAAAVKTEEICRNLDSIRAFVQSRKYLSEKYKIVARKVVTLPPQNIPTTSLSLAQKKTVAQTIKTHSVSTKVLKSLSILKPPIKIEPSSIPKPPQPQKLPPVSSISSTEMKKPLLRTYSASRKAPKPLPKLEKVVEKKATNPPEAETSFIVEDDEILIDYNDSDHGNSQKDLEEDPLAPKCEATESKKLFCGLCEDDFSEFGSEELLIAHQKEAHGPKSSKTGTKKEKQLKRKRTETESEAKTSSEVNDLHHQEKAKEAKMTVNESPSELKEERLAPRKKKKATNYKPDRAYIHYKYSCPNCPKVKGYWLNRYAQHLAIHQRRPYRCSECLEFLPNGEDLQEQHWKDKHGDKEIPSDYEKFVKIKFDPGKIWKCFSCYSGFCSKEERNEHEHKCKKTTKSRRIALFKKEEPMTCLTCSESFRNLNEWRLHRVLEHPEVDSLSCLMCNTSFSAQVVGRGDGVVARDDYKFLEHLRKDHKIRERCDTRIYEECEQCGVVLNGGENKPTKKNHILKEHKRDGGNLNDQKELLLYPCKFCLNRSFVNAPSLRIHMATEHFLHHLINSSEGAAIIPSRVFLCDNCGKTVSSKHYLLHHRYIKHGIIPEGEGQKIFNCPKEGCQYKSPTKSYVDTHNYKIHVLELTRPFKCKYCPMALKSAAELRRHHQIHENKETRPFQCELCGNSYTGQVNLRTHVRHVHEKKPYPPSQKNRKRRPPKKK